MLIYSIPEEHRSAREKFRKELTWRGFSSLAASTWVSPHDRSEGLRSFLPPGSQMQIFSSRTPSAKADVEIAASCWDLISLNQDYKDFIEPLSLGPIIRNQDFHPSKHSLGEPR